MLGKPGNLPYPPPPLFRKEWGSQGWAVICLKPREFKGSPSWASHIPSSQVKQPDCKAGLTCRLVGEWDVPCKALCPVCCAYSGNGGARGQPELQLPRWETHAPPLAKLPFICSGNQVQCGLLVPKEASRGSSGGLGDCQQLPSSLACCRTTFRRDKSQRRHHPEGKPCSLQMASEAELGSVLNT